jgi:hypothetical protein
MDRVSPPAIENYWCRKSIKNFTKGGISMAEIQQWGFRQRSIRLQLGLSTSVWPGTCFGLSYDWCKSVLSGRIPEEGTYDVNKSYVWTITSQHRAKRGAFSMGTMEYQYLAQLCRGDHIVLQPEITGNQMDDNLVRIIDDDGAVPVGSAVILGAPGHVMAFAKTGNQAGYFFDANEGQWKVWGMFGGEIVRLAKADNQGEWELWIMSGQPRDRAHYLSR